MLAGLATLAACGSGGSTGQPPIAGGDFVARQSEPTNGATIYLNDPIHIDFTKGVDLDSADLTTVGFQALDQNGDPTSELVNGTFALTTSPGDTSIGRRLQFVPRLATDDDFANGGLRAGRTYLVTLVGGEQRNGTVLRDHDGKGLERGQTFGFRTVDGTQPAELYRNPRPGGPAFQRLEIGSSTARDDVPLNLFGAPALEVRLTFDQALNPSSENVPVALDTNPLTIQQSQRGRIFLEYDDPVLNPGPAEYTWLPARFEIERNDLTGAVVVLRPIGVLPNNATVRVVVEPQLEDIAGESHAANPAYERVVAEFRTVEAYEQQWNGIVEEFTSHENIDFAAVFPEAQATAGPGFLKAGFAFEGTPTSLEYEPLAIEVVLNTDFTQVVPKAGLPFTVSGGVFNFRNVTIPEGVTVLGQGSRPMVWLCSGDFRVAGTLSVRGGNGARVDTLQSANFAKAGGVGVCGGGNGGDGTPSATKRDLTGEAGNGPLQVPGKGGSGGKIACGLAGCLTTTGGGSGGGGGSFATQGDPNYRWNPGAVGTSFQQVLGIGGAGCGGASGSAARQLPGGASGPKVFTDSRADNDFWGSAIQIHGNLRITGELSLPMGGGGGGGGGDGSPTGSCTENDPQAFNDYSGGGGGAGGGILIVKALGEIEVTRTGKILADGGNGGGGEQAGSCNRGGGGGGGAGGMVVLMSAKRIVLHSHGSPAANRWNYSQNDYDFVVSADGGLCTTGTFGTPNVADKYPQSGSAMLAGTEYDSRPLGGLGGMGIVQLMVPPGEAPAPGTDGTNTRLDDNLVVMRHTVGGQTLTLTGLEKQRALAWRGFANSTGTFVDDNNLPLNIGKDEGDIRPSPILLPVPFSAKSRLRSKWIDTGASQRRLLTAPDDQPRGLVGTEAGPIYSFAGLDNTNPVKGYVDFLPTGPGAVTIDYPTVVPAMPLTSVAAEGFHYRLSVASATALGEDNRYAQYEAELRNSNDVPLASFRILSHTGNTLVIDGSTGVLPVDATTVRVLAKFFRIVTNNTEGLGPVYAPTPGANPIPRANVRIGFAFHADPAAPTGRFPADAQTYVHDVDGLRTDPAFQAFVAANGNPRYVQWDVTFDMTYTEGGSVNSLSPTSPRPELHFLRLPFRF